MAVIICGPLLPSNLHWQNALKTLSCGISLYRPNLQRPVPFLPVLSSAKCAPQRPLGIGARCGWPCPPQQRATRHYCRASRKGEDTTIVASRNALQFFKAGAIVFALQPRFGGIKMLNVLDGQRHRGTLSDPGKNEKGRYRLRIGPSSAICP